jgi:hypothetical protein
VPSRAGTAQRAPQPILAGQTWNFQAWHRDAAAGPDGNNNFTDAVQVTFE